MKTRYKQLNYAELQKKLSELEDGIGQVSGSLEEALRQTRVMLSEFHNVVNQLAAYNDKEANKHLVIHDSYEAFDEPRAVQMCRELLSRL